MSPDPGNPRYDGRAREDFQNECNFIYDIIMDFINEWGEIAVEEIKEIIKEEENVNNTAKKIG